MDTLSTNLMGRYPETDCSKEHNKTILSLDPCPRIWIYQKLLILNTKLQDPNLCYKKVYIHNNNKQDHLRQMAAHGTLFVVSCASFYGLYDPESDGDACYFFNACDLNPGPVPTNRRMAPPSIAQMMMSSVRNPESIIMNQEKE